MIDTEFKLEVLSLEDAWIKYELSDVNQSFSDFLKELEVHGYKIDDEEGTLNESK